MQFHKMTDKEVSSRRKRNIVIAVSLLLLSLLFLITTMVRMGALLDAG